MVRELPILPNPRLESDSPLRQMPDDWAEKPINETNEPLVDFALFLSDQGCRRIVTFSQYYYRGYEGGLRSCFVREEVAKRLVKAAEKLPDNLMLMVWDAWRPESVQRALFQETVNKFKDKGVSEADARRQAAQYAADPDDWSKLPPHATGGAVDVTLVWQEDLTPLGMGTPHDGVTEKAATDYFEKEGRKRKLSSKEERQRNNRRLLYQVMTEVGFTNYREEWWHFDYGNQFWAAMSGDNKSAFYGRTNTRHPLQEQIVEDLKKDYSLVEVERRIIKELAIYFCGGRWEAKVYTKNTDGTDIVGIKHRTVLPNIQFEEIYPSETLEKILSDYRKQALPTFKQQHKEWCYFSFPNAEVEPAVHNYLALPHSQTNAEVGVFYFDIPKQARGLDDCGALLEVIHSLPENTSPNDIGEGFASLIHKLVSQPDVEPPKYEYESYMDAETVAYKI